MEREIVEVKQYTLFLGISNDESIRVLRNMQTQNCSKRREAWRQQKIDEIMHCYIFMTIIVLYYKDYHFICTSRYV